MRRGFTLIELLVVIAIIAVLSAVLIVSFSDARLKSRDAKRLTDMKEIANALALYYNNTGRFPISASQIVLTSNDAVSVALESALVISNVPIDPRHSAFTYRYQSNAGGTTYTLTFCQEGANSSRYAPNCNNTFTP
jgi:prepilin-type N-terminal cleavage/methylation domain-containing protein